MSKYTKLTDCDSAQTFTISNHNDAIYNCQLYVYEITSFNGSGKTYSYSLFSKYIQLGEKKYVYLGYEDTQGNVDRNLQSVITSYIESVPLDSDPVIPGCSATLHLSSGDTTGAEIRFSLNKCTSDRVITFSYNNRDIFQIKQTYTQETTTTYHTIYVCVLNRVESDMALFEYGNTNILSFELYGNIYNKTKMYNNSVGQSHIDLIYFSDDTFMLNSTAQQLINKGSIEHVSGNDDLLTNDTYKSLYIQKLDTVNVFDNIGTTTVHQSPVTKNMTIVSYHSNGNQMVQTSERINFNNTSASNHLGVYKIKR